MKTKASTDLELETTKTGGRCLTNDRENTKSIAAGMRERPNKRQEKINHAEV